MLVGGCKVGPDYHPPEQQMPATWVAPPTTQASITIQEPLQVEQWWTTFNDAELDSLIRRAVHSNLNVQIAAERIRQSRANLGIATAGFFPVVNADGSLSHTYVSGTNSAGKKTGTVDLWRAGFDATWELDIFGGVRRNIEASNATYEASIEDRRDVLVTLLGDVATAYIQLRGFQQQIIIAQENLASQERSLRITRDKLALGSKAALDVANAEAQVATTKSDIATFQSLAQQQIYTLSVLLGEEPSALLPELSPQAAIPTTPPVVPVGLPSELLRRRPDIRRAERQLAAATALVGVAVADLFPKFSLDGAVHVGGPRFENLGNWATRSWSFGPSFTWPVFDAGAIWSNVEAQKAIQSQVMLSYRQTVLQALQDVENALTAYAQEQQRRAALADAVAANQRALGIATRGYQEGLTDFLNVVVTQQALFSAQNQLVQSNQAVATDLVALYKALGGGWEIGEPTTQPARQ
jgi:NodT family efflux transporter outer membrane factor (OMF) lipoprotein